MANIYSYNAIDVLKADGCSDKEAKAHLEKGTTIYTPEDYDKLLKDCPELAEEMNISGVDQILEMCKSDKRIVDTYFTTYKNIPCVVEYVL